MRALNQVSVAAGLLLTLSGVANAQTTLLDSLGNGGVGSPGTTIGYEPASGGALTPSTSGFTVLPFSLASGSSADGSAAQSVTTSVTINPPNPGGANAGKPSGNLFGAFIDLGPGGNATGQSLQSLQSGLVSYTGGIGQSNAFFQFDLVGGGAEADPGTGVLVGTGNRSNVTATIAGAGPTFKAGDNYLLVLSGNSKLNLTDADTNTLDQGNSTTFTTANLGVNGGSLTSAAGATETLRLNSFGSANPLGTTGPRYVGARILVAPVPEASSVITMLIGGLPIGLLVARRRRNK